MSNTLRNRLEKTVVQYLQTLGLTGVNFVSSHEDGERETPFCIVLCDRSDAVHREMGALGNYRAALKMLVAHTARTDDSATHEAAADAIFAALDIPETSAAPGLAEIAATNGMHLYCCRATAQDKADTAERKQTALQFEVDLVDNPPPDAETP